MYSSRTTCRKMLQLSESSGYCTSPESETGSQCREQCRCSCYGQAWDRRDKSGHSTDVDRCRSHWLVALRQELRPSATYKMTSNLLREKNRAPSSVLYESCGDRGIRCQTRYCALQPTWSGTIAPSYRCRSAGWLSRQSYRRATDEPHAA